MFRKIRRVFIFVLMSSLIFIVFKATPFSVSNSNSFDKIIVVDAGHGGKDGGAIGLNGNYEKDINLEVAGKLIKKLRAKGYRVISTRDSDEYVDNLDRVKLANKNNSHLFVSIHCNSMENNSSVKGVQVLYYPDRESSIVDSTNSTLAQTILDSIVGGTGAIDKGVVERNDLLVLKQTKMQAIIIECGFLSNKKEERLLTKGAYQNKIVDSIIDGLEDYFSLEL